MRHSSSASSFEPSSRVISRRRSMCGRRTAPSSPLMAIVSLPVRPRVLRSSPSLNCRGSTPMPTRLERWMRSKLSAITALTPSRLVPLAAQSREDPVPYSLPATITSGVPSAW
ncbi:hypothetical protein D3C72_1957660 [compost metagenome]